jgi:hypothetical protein
MDRGEYHERKNQLKWRVRVGWVVGLVFGLLLSWTIVGLYIGWKGYRMAEKASNERKELEQEYENYLDEKPQSAAV